MTTIAPSGWPFDPPCVTNTPSQSYIYPPSGSEPYPRPGEAGYGQGNRSFHYCGWVYIFYCQPPGQWTVGFPHCYYILSHRLPPLPPDPSVPTTDPAQGYWDPTTSYGNCPSLLYNQDFPCGLPNGREPYPRPGEILADPELWPPNSAFHYRGWIYIRKSVYIMEQGFYTQYILYGPLPPLSSPRRTPSSPRPQTPSVPPARPRRGVPPLPYTPRKYSRGINLIPIQNNNSYTYKIKSDQFSQSLNILPSPRPSDLVYCCLPNGCEITANTDECMALNGFVFGKVTTDFDFSIDDLVLRTDSPPIYIWSYNLALTYRIYTQAMRLASNTIDWDRASKRAGRITTSDWDLIWKYSLKPNTPSIEFTDNRGLKWKQEEARGVYWNVARQKHYVIIEHIVGPVTQRYVMEVQVVQDKNLIYGIGSCDESLDKFCLDLNDPPPIRPSGMVYCCLQPTGCEIVSSSGICTQMGGTILGEVPTNFNILLDDLVPLHHTTETETRLTNDMITGNRPQVQIYSIEAFNATDVAAWAKALQAAGTITRQTALDLRNPFSLPIYAKTLSFTAKYLRKKITWEQIDRNIYYDTFSRKYYILLKSDLGAGRDFGLMEITIVDLKNGGVCDPEQAHPPLDWSGWQNGPPTYKIKKTRNIVSDNGDIIGTRDEFIVSKIPPSMCDKNKPPFKTTSLKYSYKEYVGETRTNCEREDYGQQTVTIPSDFELPVLVTITGTCDDTLVINNEIAIGTEQVNTDIIECEVWKGPWEFIIYPDPNASSQPTNVYFDIAAADLAGVYASYDLTIDITEISQIPDIS